MIGGKSLHILLRDWSHIYGDVFRLKLGSKETVVLSSRKAIQEALVKQAKIFAGRPDLPTFEWTRNGQTGLSLCTYTEEFKVNKSIAVAALHTIVNQHDLLDHVLEQEVGKMYKLFDNYSSQPFCPFSEFRRIVPSVFIHLLFNQSREYEDPVMTKVRDTYNLWFEVAEADNPADYFPFMLKFANKRLETAKECSKVFETFTVSMVEENVRGVADVGDESTSLFDNLLFQYSKKNQAPLSHAEKVRLAKILSDMVGGAFDTGAATLSWAMLYLINNPIILQTCREEVRKNTTNGHIRSTDVHSLPYTAATLYDIYRLSSVAPLGIVHEVLKDTTLMGYNVRKGTMVLPNLWVANHDADKWKYPDILYPEHFLNDEGKLDMNATRELMSFSAGIRACPGKGVSFVTTLVLLSALIHRFAFSIEEEPIDLTPERGLTLKPKHYTISLSNITGSTL